MCREERGGEAYAVSPRPVNADVLSCRFVCVSLVVCVSSVYRLIRACVFLALLSHGCKVTVEILGNLASKSIKRMEKAKVDSSKPLDMTALSAGLCSSQEYAEYESFVEDSCIKLLNDHRYHFLHAFAGVCNKCVSSAEFSLSRDQ
jgi:hypothetical protein